MKYECSMCGYIYDEDVEGVKFTDLPESWTCPLCGAPKDAFELVKEVNNDAVNEEIKEMAKEEKKELVEEVKETNEIDEDMVELNYQELAALFTSLARGAEKQYLDEESKCFLEIAKYFENNATNDGQKNMDLLSALMDQSLASFVSYRTVATSNADRGSLRSITWGEKVTKLAKGLVDRYIKEGDAFLKDTHIFICTVCGFIYVGDKAPEVCPICKVPGFKFEEVKGGK